MTMTEIEILAAKLDALCAEAEAIGLARSFAEALYTKVKGYGKLKDTAQPAKCHA